MPPTTRPTPPPEPHAAQEAANREQKRMEMQRLAELRSDASSRLKTAKSMLNKAGQLGIDVSKLNDILAKAEQAYQKENYTHAINYLKNYFASIDQAEKSKKQLEQMQKSAGGQIQSTNFLLQKAEKLGVTVKRAKELNLKAQSAFDANDYSSAITYANQSNDAAKKLIDESEPSISIELPTKMQHEVWKHRDLTVTNEGTAHAVAIAITFLTALEVRDLGVVKRLDVGDQKTINVNIKPTEKGEVPVDYSVAFKDLMGRDYKIEDSFNLQIGIGAEVAEGRADYERKTISPHTFTTLRTVWDPSNKDFVWGAEKPEEYGELPQIKRWIKDKNPNIYWFLLKIVNRADYPVTEWNVALYTEQALTILEAHLDKQQVRIVKSDFDTDGNKNICVVAIPPELGVSIPANGGRRSMYFKMDIRCEDALKMEFGVSGVVKLGKSPHLIEVPIKEKRFTYACKYGDFRNMYYGSIDALASMAVTNLQDSYSRQTCRV
jgi:CRISPR/Cas system CMR-associated protein Cmr5 small subunit